MTANDPLADDLLDGPITDITLSDNPDGGGVMHIHTNTSIYVAELTDNEYTELHDSINNPSHRSGNRNDT